MRFCWNWFQQTVAGMGMDMVRSFDDIPVGSALERKLEDLAGKDYVAYGRGRSERFWTQVMGGVI